MEGAAPGQGRYLGQERNNADAAPDTTRSSLVSMEGTGVIWADGCVGSSCVDRLHSVLALLPQAQITPVAHARLVQSFPGLAKTLAPKLDNAGKLL
jgi:hypothetical protein